MPDPGTLLDVVISLTFVYALTSVLCSTVRELVASFLQARQKTLAQAIHRLCGANDDPAMSNDLADRILRHPTIRSLTTPGKRGPSYLPARLFASTLVDVLADMSRPDGETAPRLRQMIAAVPNADLQRVLTMFAREAHQDVREFRTQVEDWYEDAMDRVSGWYKRRTRAWILIFGFIVALAFNIDSLEIARAVWADAELRGAISERLDKATPEGALDSADAETVLALLHVRSMPIGWATAESSGPITALGAMVNAILDHPVKLVGFAVTALAVSLGSDFWFSLLRRLVNLRAAGSVPQRRRRPESATTGAPSPLPTTSPDLPERPESELEASGLTRDDIEDIQRALGLTGRFLTGRLDPSTRSMIEEFQLSVGRRPTGILTPYLVERLLPHIDR